MKYFFTVILNLLMLGVVFGQQTQNKIQTQSSLAFRYFNARDFEKAAPLMYEVYTLTRNSTYFKYHIDCLIQMEMFDEALAKIQQELKKQKPEIPEYYVHWGQVLKARKLPDESIAKYEKALGMVSGDRNSYTFLANAFLGWREFEYSKKTYLKGEKVLGQGVFDYELARAYSYLRDYENMMEKYLDLLSQNEEYLSRVQSGLSSTMRLDIDDEMLREFRSQVLKRIQNNPDVIAYNRLLIWFFLQENKFSSALRQSIALDKRTGTEDNQIIQLGNMALNNKSYDDAQKAFDYLMGKGPESQFFKQSFALKVHASYMHYIGESPSDSVKAREVAHEFVEALEYLGVNGLTLNLVQENAHLLAFYLGKTEEALNLLNEALKIPRLKPEEEGSLKTEMADIYVFANDPWEATLIYSQVIDKNKDNSLGDEVKLKKAKLGYYLGNFSWAKAQLDVLKASTSKLTANDAMELSLLIGNNLNLDTTAVPLQMFARADLYFFQNKNEPAMATLDSLTEMYPYHTLVDDILFRKANIEIEKQNYVLAAEYLQGIINDFSYELLGDNATFLLAELYQYNLNEKEKARDFYKSILTNYPGSVFTEESREKYRVLRQQFPDNELVPEPQPDEEEFMKGTITPDEFEQ
jgi:outer membrane protein assembly factor BamD (BamD/ComL family)